MSKALRISLITETWAPEINGVAMTLGQLVGQLQRQGHRVQLVRPRQPGERCFSSDELMLVSGVAIPGYRELRLGLPAGRALKRNWRQQRPDVIYVATEGPLGWSAVRSAETLGIPAVSGFHTQFHQYSGYYGAAWLQPLIYGYLKSLHNRTSSTLVPTEAMRRDMNSDFRNVRVLGRGIDTHLFNPQKRCENLRREWGAGEQDTVFLYVGRLAREKNIDTVLSTFLRLRHNNERARLVLVGHGPDYQRLYERHEGVIFVGSKTDEELARHYASADLFLFPSMSETFGNVVLEAMASGLAVVAYDEAAAGIHIRHGENGMLAESGDEASFLRHSSTLLNNRGYRQGLREAARHDMQGISWEQVGNEFERILRSSVNEELSDESNECVAADFSR
jgi:glycosyltransferase involved in cell wall biosynthesis